MQYNPIIYLLSLATLFAVTPTVGVQRFAVDKSPISRPQASSLNTSGSSLRRFSDLQGK